MKYNFLQWWLSVSIKPKVYQVWKYIITFTVFIGWVACIAIYRDLYWKYSLCIMLPVAIVDLIWDAINYAIYNKKLSACQSETQDSNTQNQPIE
ncbi:MAG: hypothetical protein ACI4MO_00760 [Christensenellales bacterium]